jgi:hypothetical protein
MGRSSRMWLAAASAVALFGAATAAIAADLRPGTIAVGAGGGATLQLNCDNGKVYPIRPRAVSDAGELVTGYLYTAPRRAAHFRLIPMGNGYRYSGHGFWFDGVRGEAVLELGQSTNCTVEHQAS